MNTQSFVNFKSMTRELTARCVEMMPEDKMNFKPAPNSRTFAEIVLHILEADHMLMNLAAGSEEAPAKPYKTENFTARKSLVEALRGQLDRTKRLAMAMKPERMKQMVKSPFGMEMPAEDWLTLVLTHEAEHRGNLVVMAKMNGVTPPDIIALRQEMAAQVK